MSEDLKRRSLIGYLRGPGSSPQPAQALPTGAPTWKPSHVIYHDYGGTPQNKEGVFNPYHALVFPDGSIRYRYPDNPYGQKAPHAHMMNPHSVGLSYAGQVGSKPTPAALATLQAENAKLQKMFPGIRGLGHGEAYQQTKGTPMQASKLGRDIIEASWRSQLGGPIPPSGAAQGQQTPTTMQPTGYTQGVVDPFRQDRPTPTMLYGDWNQRQSVNEQMEREPTGERVLAPGYVDDRHKQTGDGYRDQPPMASATQNSPQTNGGMFSQPQSQQPHAQQQQNGYPKWGSDHYGDNITWGNGDKSYLGGGGGMAAGVTSNQDASLFGGKPVKTDNIQQRTAINPFKPLQKLFGAA